MLVFEVAGQIQDFATAIQKVSGSLSLLDEEELQKDDGNISTAYLLIPDARALRHIESLWKRWTSGEKLPIGFAKWRDVFATLRELRTWGPQDRVSDLDHDILSQEIEGRNDTELVNLEIEFVFRKNDFSSSLSKVINNLKNAGGKIISQADISEIAYQAILVSLPVSEIRNIIDSKDSPLVWEDAIQYIRPQSISATSETAEPIKMGPVPSFTPSEASILALIDGTIISKHPLLDAHLNVEDLFGLEAQAIIADRQHGTAMASLIIHGDLNNSEPPLPRKIHVTPVLGAGDRFPEDRLIIDLIHQAVISMRNEKNPSAQFITIINLSLGDARRPFFGKLSAWARLIDTLSYKYGILFIVSAGNINDAFQIPSFQSMYDFENATDETKSKAVIEALNNVAGHRGIFSPAETVNGLTIGASNKDWMQERVESNSMINPFPNLTMINPSSALGPGFARSVKPDLIFPSGREHLTFSSTMENLKVRPSGRATRAGGVKVAAPPIQGDEASVGYSNGTSAATAIASRTAHRIHDALEREYKAEFLGLEPRQRATLLKALLIHPATWPEETAALIKEVVGPQNNQKHAQQKDNIRRFLGYGTYDPDDAVACASDRATFWTVGALKRDQRIPIHVPIPTSYTAKPRFHSISATLAWMTPTNPGRKSYRSVRLELNEPGSLSELSVSTDKAQPDRNQSKRGTVFSRTWSGKKAARLLPNKNFVIEVQRQPDSGTPIDDDIHFALAVTLNMPGVEEIYEEVRQRIRPRPIPVGL